MDENLNNNEPVLVLGNDRLAYSVSVCLIKAGHPVVLYTQDKDHAIKEMDVHFKDLSEPGYSTLHHHGLEVVDNLSGSLKYKLVIAVTGEDIADKKDYLQIEKKVQKDTIIAINTESIPLNILQDNCSFPERIIGVNWVEPAHTTFFLELIINKITDRKYADKLFHLAKTQWKKNPYLISNGIGIRARMFAALAREALYLVQNEYASVEDIDRACRNDPGYYLPFAGNCRYMDLMGTYAYGMVMKELNPDLSKDREVPDFFREIIEEGGLGMENEKGFYQYEAGEAERWDRMFRKFSYQIEETMRKYPFNYKNEVSSAEKKINSNGRE